MPKFFSIIFKQKKLTFFILLFLVLSGIIIPQLTIASSWNPWNPEFYLTDDGQLTGLGSTINTAVDNFGEAVMVPFAATVLAVGVILVVVFGTLSVLAGTLLTTIIAMDVGCYTCMSNPAIAAGWPAVRDLANMVIVLGFVVIGIATTLRFKEYEAKKLLPKLIIAALLINFSLVICGIFIDGSNIMAKNFNKSGGFFERSWEQTISDQTSKIWAEWKGKSYKEAAIGILGAATGLTFYNIIAIVIFFLYAFLYLFRHMALWILVILSPLAFVCYVFPATKKFFDMWWSNFFNWCIIVVPISFFVWIADTIMSGISKAAGSSSPPILSYLIPGFFMLIGFIFSLKISAMGAGAAIGLAKGAIGLSGKVGMGTLKGLGRGADKLSGGKLSSATQAVKGGVGRTMERIGLRKEGLTAMKEGSMIAEEQKRYEAMFKSGNTADRARATQATKTGRGKNRAGAYAAAVATENINDVFKDKATGAIDVDAMGRGAKFAEQFGAGENLRKQALKQNPLLAATDESKVDENIRKLGYANRFQAGPAGLAKAKAMTIGDAVKSTSPGDAAKWDENMLTPEVFAALNKNQAIEIAKRGKPKLVEKLKNYKRAVDASGNAIRNISDPRQSAEFQAIANHINTNFGPLGSGSPEEKHIISLLDEMHTNDVFN